LSGFILGNLVKLSVALYPAALSLLAILVSKSALTPASAVLAITNIFLPFNSSFAFLPF